jgi:hypothetical protein
VEKHCPCIGLALDDASFDECVRFDARFLRGVLEEVICAYIVMSSDECPKGGDFDLHVALDGASVCEDIQAGVLVADIFA